MRRLLLSLLACSAFPASALAWDYAGHRVVNQLALSTLPPDFPGFVQSKEARERIAFLAGEPDRWRNTDEPSLKHVNSPDHYIDLEELEGMNLRPEELTEFRYVFDAQLAAARAAHPEKFQPVVPARNKEHIREQIGFLPWAIAENYGKLKSAFSYLKAYEEAGTPAEIANAQANAIYVMGILGHFVGDGAQPLHTSRNANGWVDANPRGYSRSNKFHAWIDGGFFQRTGGISAEPLQDRVHPAHLLHDEAAEGRAKSVYPEILAYLERGYSQVEPLYQLDKDNGLSPKTPKKGRAFLEHQIVTGAEMLGSLWYTAWRDAPADSYLLNALRPKNRAGGSNEKE